MVRIIVTDVFGKDIESWVDGGDTDNDGFDADWCIEHGTLGTDLPIDIIQALKEARENERRHREQ